MEPHGGEVCAVKPAQNDYLSHTEGQLPRFSLHYVPTKVLNKYFSRRHSRRRRRERYGAARGTLPVVSVAPVAPGVAAHHPVRRVRRVRPVYSLPPRLCHAAAPPSEWAGRLIAGVQGRSAVIHRLRYADRQKWRQPPPRPAEMAATAAPTGSTGGSLPLRPRRRMELFSAR